MLTTLPQETVVMDTEVVFDDQRLTQLERSALFEKRPTVAKEGIVECMTINSPPTVQASSTENAIVKFDNKCMSALVLLDLSATFAIIDVESIQASRMFFWYDWIQSYPST